jgi:pilus assembly protein Flp/PilA
MRAQHGADIRVARPNEGPLVKLSAIKFARDENGATAIEYGMIAALIAAVIIGTLQLVGTQLNAKFALISAQFN